MVSQVEKQMMQGDVGKTGLIINKVQHKRANTNVLPQIREGQEDGKMGETFRLFLENWHEQVPLSHACALMHAAWEQRQELQVCTRFNIDLISHTAGVQRVMGTGSIRRICWERKGEFPFV